VSRRARSSRRSPPRSRASASAPGPRPLQQPRRSGTTAHADTLRTLEGGARTSPTCSSTPTAGAPAAAARALRSWPSISTPIPSTAPMSARSCSGRRRR
jgi:hypothetical protein